jgi:xanthine dehydrogenase accessory factor
MLGEDGPVSEAERLDMACGGRASLFYDYIGYQGHIFIFGAGHVGRAIAYHLKGLQFHVTAVDHRQEVLADLEGADRLILADYDELLQEERVPQGAFHVIATPSHAFDYIVLREIFAANWRPQYIGVLASRRKAEGMLRRLADELGDRADLGLVYCPVGLALGGRSPDDIAIAIVAEILALQHGRTELKHMRLTMPESPE